MARPTKTPEPSATAAAATVAAATPKTAKASKIPEPVTPAPAPVTTVDESATGEVADASAFGEFTAKFAALGNMMKETQAALKTLSKDYARMQKVLTKSERKKANARVNPNGFAKPTPITDALSEFLGVPKGSEMSRTDVTRKVNAYIKEHNLNKPENKRFIVPDAKLCKLFNVKATEEVSFFNLQRYLSPLFIKTPKPATA